jgi:copper chaperone CopZ
MTIEREVGGMAGVDGCQVDVDSRQVRVTFNPSQTSPAQIAQRLDEEGYPVQG